MKLIVDDNKFKMAFISGPSHNFLSLVVVNNKLNFNFKLNDLSDLKNTVHNQQLIMTQILDGLEQVNKELGTHYRISSAEYFSTDIHQITFIKFLLLILLKKLMQTVF